MIISMTMTMVDIMSKARMKRVLWRKVKIEVER